MLVPDRRTRLRDVLLLIRTDDAQVSRAGQVQAAPAGALREVIDNLVRLAPAHRGARRAGLLPAVPLLFCPLGGAPLLPGRRPASGQVIAARRHRGVPRVPGRGTQGRVQLLPQLRDQRCQCRDLPRLLADQRITRILRRQRPGHGTRSSPRPAPLAPATHASQPNRDLDIRTQRHPKLKQTEGRECLQDLVSADISDARNEWLHGRRTSADLDRLKLGLEKVADAVRLVEESGFSRQRYSWLRDEIDGQGRRTSILGNASGRQLALFRPSPFAWLGLPTLSNSWYVMHSARFAEPSEVLRFGVELESAFARLWSDYPRRPAAERLGRAVAGLGTAENLGGSGG